MFYETKRSNVCGINKYNNLWTSISQKNIINSMQYMLLFVISLKNHYLVKYHYIKDAPLDYSVFSVLPP